MVKKLISVLLALVLCGALFPAAAEDASPDGTEDIIAKMPEPGWVLDSVNGAIWQDDRASLEVFLEDVDNYKVDINWGSSAWETAEWVYACDYDAETQTLKARYVVCDHLVYDEAGNETRTNEYEKDSEAVFSLDEEGRIVLQNAGDDSLEGKTFTKITGGEPVEETAGGEAENTESGEFRDLQYILYLGTNDKDTNRPVFTQAEALEKAKDILIRNFGGYTIQEAHGGWIDNETEYQEYTLVIYLSDTTIDKVHAAADEMISVFNQSSILIQENPTRTQYYSGGN